MKRYIANVLLVLSGFLFCLGIQTGFNVFHRLLLKNEKHSASPYQGAKDDRKMTDMLDRALKRGDIKTVNEILHITPGDLQLIANVCPVYPNKFVPVSRIYIKNISSHAITVLKPIIERVTSPSYINAEKLCDDFSISWSFSADHISCRVLMPGQVMAFPIQELNVDGVGVHEVHFTISAPSIDSIEDNRIKATFSTVGETTAVFKTSN